MGLGGNLDFIGMGSGQDWVVTRMNRNRTGLAIDGINTNKHHWTDLLLPVVGATEVLIEKGTVQNMKNIQSSVTL